MRLFLALCPLLLLAAGAAAPPATPVITEPSADDQIVSPADFHMEAWSYSDPDGNPHLNSDVEIVKTSTAEKIWEAPAIGGIEKNHLHLGDGTFVGSYAGRRDLEYDTQYKLRFRFRDSTGEVSPWAERVVRTSTAGPPGVPGPVPFTAALGFTIDVVAEGFEMPVNIAFHPAPGPNPTDPLFYVSELYGTIKVVLRNGTVSTYAGGSALGPPSPNPASLLNFNPTGSFPGSGEQGLAGICIDPVTKDVFVGLLYASPAPSGPHYPKVIRLHSTDGGLTASSMTTILDMPGETQGQSHFISNLSIGPDGMLYVHNGDGFDYTTSQNLDSFRGKVLRMNLNGTAPSDNPFYNAANGITARDYVWASGLRNPFGGGWRASDGAHYEVENGPNTDRFAKVAAGQNLGWDNTDASMTIAAIHNWTPAHAPVNIAFIQSSTFGGSLFPAAKMDRAYVTESGPTYGQGPQALGKRITEFQLDGAGNKLGMSTLVEYAGTGRGTCVGLAAGPDGLYFTELYKDQNATSPVQAGARVFRVRWVGTPQGSGTGLQGEYFNVINVNVSPTVTRIDPTIDFLWATGSPAAGIPVDNFAVRWTGYVTPVSSETYTFTTRSDDGVRLWVNGVPLVDNWTDHGPTDDSGQITLQAGQSYPIRMEYYEKGDHATAQLSWATPTIAKQIIPQSALSLSPQASTVASPVFTPTPGTFSAPISVSIATATTGASIRYTTDGSAPTSTTGLLYSAPVPISATTTFRAIATKSGMTDSAVVTGAYTYSPPVAAAPTFSPAPGTFSSPMSVTMSTSTAGATIRYTTDGSAPTSTIGTVYTAPVAISATTTFKAIAYAAGMVDSTVTTATYTYSPPVVAAPTFSPAPGPFSGPISVTISSATAGASIRYTTDGSTPTSSLGTLYTAPVAISATTTFKAIAFAAGMVDSAVSMATYTSSPPVVASPTFSPAPGPFSSPMSVTISSATAGASIRYTTDGTTPTSTIGTLYAGPVAISATTTFKAIAFAAGMTDSAVTSATYTLSSGGNGLVGEYFNAINLTIPPTLTRIDPTIDFQWGNGSPGAGIPVNLFAARWTGFVTAVSNETYTFTTRTDDGARLWVNGVQLVNNWADHAPTENSGQIALLAGQSYAIRMEYYEKNGGATAQLYWATPTLAKQIVPQAQLSTAPLASVVAAPAFTPAPGSFAAPMSVTISSATTGASIRYTTDGTTPSSTLGILYAGPVAISASTTFRAIAFKSGMTDSSVTTAAYTYAPPVTAAPTFSPTPGPFPTPMSVTISSATTGASIRYTTDGTTPTSTLGILYAGPVAISATTTFRAIAFKAGNVDSTVSAATYTYSPGVVANPTYSPAPGTFAAPMSVTISTTTAGASIRYTTDGSTPSSTVGTIYTAPVAISATTTFRAIAFAAGMVDSAVTTATYTYSPAPGTFATPMSVTISTTTVGASIRYTTDGSTPSSAVGTIYTAPVAISATTTFRAIAYNAGMVDSAVTAATYTYSPVVAAPTFSPAPGTFSSPMSVTISSATSGATIRYTTDGSTPSSTVGTVYTAPVAITATTTFRAIAYNAGMTDSAVTTAAYTFAAAGNGLTGEFFNAINLTIAPTVTRVDPTVNFLWGEGSPAPGIPVDLFAVRWTGFVTAVSDETYTFTTRSDDGVRLWVNNVQLVNNWTDHGPTEDSGQIVLQAGQSYAIRMEYYEKGGAATAQLSWATATIPKQIVPASALSLAPQNTAAAAPTFSPAPGDFSSPISVSIASLTSGATIRYTTDGTTPTSASGLVYSAPVPISVTTTFRAIAYKSGLLDSAVTAATYTNVPPTVAAPTFSPAPGPFSSPMSVTISTATAGATIRYTTDGSTPSSTIGTPYTAPVAISATTTFRAIAYSAGMTDSAVTSATYTFLPPGSGTGLTADYYTGLNFNTLSFSRVDPFVDFLITEPQTFVPGFPTDDFTIRWTGTVQAPFTETYTFYMLADDGVRLWINGQLVIDKWINQAATEYSALVPLVAGQQADVKIEYYEAFGAARCRFAWSSPSIPKETVPQIRLYPAAAVLPKSAVSRDPQSLVDAALPGETVTLDAGTYLVAGGLFLPPAVSLKGAGPGRTVLEGGVWLLGGPADGQTTVEGITILGGLHTGSADSVLRHLVVVGSAGDGIAGDAGGVVTGVHLTVADHAGRAIAVAGSLSLRNSIVSGGISAGSGLTVTASSVDEPVSFLADYRAAPGSSTIDAGDPADPFDAEPAPNGGRVNQGAFGNTPDAEPTATALKAGAGTGTSSKPDGGCGATGMELLLVLAFLAAQRRSR